MGHVYAVVVGAGSGTRFGGDEPKQYRELAGRTLFRHALEAFIGHPSIAGVLPVIGPADGSRFAAACGDLPTLPPVPGGASRSASVRAALQALAAHGPSHVLIHDAARPLLPPRVIDRVLAALGDHDAVVPGIAVRDTLKRVGAGGSVAATVDRTDLVAIQTPQGFTFDLLNRAHEGADEATDDAGLVERLGVDVAIVAGDPANLKVTEPEDLPLALSLLRVPAVPRVGTGFDVHRLEPGDGVILGGVRLPCPLRLVGHSDADVGLHALTDALLATIAVGDIGTLFPPSDDRWLGADSALFIEEACRRVRAAGGTIAHLDLTLICERPKIGPHRDAIRARIADLCDVATRHCSVKATTTERLGFTGRGEGIAAQAAATVLFAT